MSTEQSRPAKKLLERENLPAIAQRVSGQQTQLRQRVEHDAGRLELLDVEKDLVRRLAQFHFGRVEHRVLLIRLERFLRRQHFAHVDAVE
jgi:hypothetical protein